MRGDLRNLLAAQEGYFSNAQTYYNGPRPRSRPAVFDLGRT